MLQNDCRWLRKSKDSNGYAGLSKRQMLHCVISNKTLTTFIVKFTKKARLHPVKVKEIYEQNQIDFVDMKSMKVEEKVKFYHLKFFLCWICFLVFTGLLLLKKKKVAM